jgi:chromosome segregation ATPase
VRDDERIESFPVMIREIETLQQGASRQLNAHLLEMALKEARAVNNRVAEDIRESEERLRAVKAVLNELRENVRRIA